MLIAKNMPEYKTVVRLDGKIILGLEQVPNDWELKENEFLVSCYRATVHEVGTESYSLLKPVWDFAKNEWQETATEAELQAAHPPQPTPPPSIERRTSALEAATLALMGGM